MYRGSEPWDLEQLNNVYTKVTSSSTKSRKGTFAWHADRNTDTSVWRVRQEKIVLDVREAVRKWITLGGEGHGNFTGVTLEYIRERQYLPYTVTGEPGCCMEDMPCGETVDAGKPVGAAAVVQAGDGGAASMVVEEVARSLDMFKE